MASDTATDLRVERKPKLSESVVAAIRKQLQAGEIQPGQKLPTEGQLTETFGVSRTVIREALAKLASEGLVEPRQGAGVFVIEHISTAFGAFASEMGTQDLDRAQRARGAPGDRDRIGRARRHPPQCGAGSGDPGSLLRIRAAAAQQRADRPLPTSPSTGPSPAPPTIRSMSRCSTCSAGAPSRATLPRHGPPNSCSPTNYQRGLQREHLVILNAISAGDAEAARDAMRVHLSASQQRYRERLQARQAYYSAHSDHGRRQGADRLTTAAARTS